MLSIEKVSCAIPQASLEVLRDYEAIGINQSQAKVYSRLYGLEKIPIVNKDGLCGLMQEAIDDVLKNETVEEIKYIIYAHTGAVVSAFGASIIRDIKYIYHLDHVQAFGTSLNKCTSVFSAFELAEQLLRFHDAKAKALIVCGEIAFSRDLRVVNGITLVGDAAGAAIVSLHGENNKLLSLNQLADGRFSRGIWLTSEEVKLLEQSTPDNLALVIQKALDEAKLNLDQIHCLLPHNVNTPSWLKCSKRLGMDINKVYLKMISKTAHCFCSDIFINYVHAKNEGYFKKGDYLLLASIGVGSIFSAAIVQC